MNKLWCFGDSFLDASSKENYHENTWTLQLAEKLNCKLMTFALGGSDLSYTYKCFNDNSDNITDGDKIIIGLTAIDRKWLFKNNPTNCVLIPNDAKEHNIIKHYRLYLDNDINNYTYMDNFIFHVKYLAKHKDVKILILHSFEDTVKYFLETDKFENINTVNYPLHKISKQEFTAEFLSKWTKILPWPGECRPNHLIRSNHNILADKLADFFINDVAVDLTMGFMQYIINSDREYDRDFCNKELFGREWAFWTPA